MASIQPYKDGRYRVYVEVNGKRRTAIHRTRREAQAWGVQAERELQSGVDGIHTVTDLLERYAREVSSHKKGADKEKLRIDALLRNFKELAAMPLAKVQAPDLAAWRDARLREVSKATVQRDMNWLRNAFRIGQHEWKWIDHNPFEGVRRPSKTPPRSRRISPAEVKRVLRAMHYRTGMPPESKVQEVGLVFLVALRTGMRAGEILSLGKNTLDLRRRVAQVPHKMQYLTGKPRDVPLMPRAARLLRVVADREQCFSVSSASLDALFRKVRDRLMLPDLHFHDTRAEALTRLARKVDVLTLARISGHADIRQLMTYYRETAEDIAARLAA